MLLQIMQVQQNPEFVTETNSGILNMTNFDNKHSLAEVLSFVRSRAN